MEHTETLVNIGTGVSDLEHIGETVQLVLCYTVLCTGVTVLP